MQPYEGLEHIWKDEKAYLNWLRSQTRRIWGRHPVKTEYRMRRRFKAPLGRNGKEVFACTCEMCGKTVRQTETQVDHLEQGGSFSNWEEYTQWAKRILWVGLDGVRELCIPCHKAVNHSQNRGISVEDARIEKEAIRLVKEKKARQWLIDRGIEPKKAKDLREQIIQKLKE